METNVVEGRNAKAVLRAVTLGALTGFGSAAALGFAIYNISMSGASASDDWAELGSALIALVIAAPVGLILYCFVGGRGLWRSVPTNRRWQSLAAFGLTPFISATIQGGMAGFYVFIVFTPVVIALTWLAVLWAAGFMRTAYFGAIAGTLVALALVGNAFGSY